MILVAILTVRRETVEQYRAYERQAAGIMARHGGRIERTVVVNGHPSDDVFKEVHIVRFPDAEALSAYKADPMLIELARVRESVVVETEVLVGEDGPDYDGDPPA